MNLVKNNQNIAKEVAQNEIFKVENLINYIDNDCEGRVREDSHVQPTARRKSAIMANKIVSTIHSTATPSLFLRATSAIHGDLGLIQNEAPVAAGSKSIVPNLKRRDPQLVARVNYTIIACDCTLQKKSIPNNQQGRFMTYVAKEGNDFFHPTAQPMTKNPTSAYGEPIWR